MASVDDRIVRLEFDNAQFQSRINQTLTSLAQLDKALKLEGATKGITDVHAAAQKTDFTGMTQAIEGISKGFVAMSTIAITALATVTNAAINAGAMIVKSLSLDQVVAGFKDYELKIGATQTIMAGTGEGIDVVTKHLKELDVYADKTIYNLRDMVSNMSKFTNAGVALPTATKAMIGIANAAARAGATSEEASRAMYNLGQAIGQGTVRLIDWKSVELANMGTLEFKQQLIDSAVAMGTLTKETDGTIRTLKGAEVNSKNFAYTLEDQWLTSEALVATLERYGDETTDIGKKSWAAAQDVKSFSMMFETLKAGISTGWTDTFDILIGNLEESKSLFTSITNSVGSFFGEMADARNELLQGWKDLGGRTLLIETLSNAFHNLGEIIKPIKDAFRDIFPPMTAQTLMHLTESFAALVDKLKPSQGVIDNLRSIFRGFFAVLDIGWEIVKNLAKFIGELVTSIFGLAGGDLLALIARFGDFATGLHDVLVEGGGIAAFFEGLTALVKAPISWLQKLRDGIAKLFGGFDDHKAEALQSVTGRISDRFENLRKVFDRLKDALGPLQNFFEKVGEVLEKVGQKVGEALSTIGSKIAEVMSSGQYDNVLDTINTGLLAAITAAIIKWIKSGFNIGVGVNIGGGVFDRVEGMFSQLTNTLKALQTQIQAQTLMKIAIAIGILTASVLVLSLIDSAALTKALVAMSVGFAQLMGAFAILTKMTLDPRSAASFSILAIGMIALSAAMILLAVAVKQLASLDWGELARGLLGTVALIGILVIASKALSGQAAHMVSAGVGIAAMSVGILLMAAAVKVFAGMSWGELARGLIGLAGGLLLIVLAMNLMPPHMALMGVGLMAVGVGLIAMGSALKIFASMSWAEIGRGLVALAGGLILIGLAMYAMPDGMITIGIGLTLVGIGLNILARALKAMGAMSWEEIARSMVTLAGALIILSVGVTGMSGSLVGAIALGVVSGALIVLAGVLKLFSKLSWGDLIDGLLKLAVAIGAIALVAVLLGPAVPAILGLAIALGILGLAFLAFGAGAMLVAKAFEMMAKAGKVGAEQLGEVLEALGEALPAFGRGIAEGLIETIQVFADGFAKLIPAFAKIIGGLLTAIETNLPKIIDIFQQLLDASILAIYEYGPQFIAVGMFLIIEFLKGIRDNIYEVVSVVVDIITGFIDAIAAPANMNQIVASGLGLLVAFIKGIADNVGSMAWAAALVIVEFMKGIANMAMYIINNAVVVIDSFLTGLARNIKRIVNAGVGFVLSVLAGIASAAVRMADGAFTVVITFINALSDVINRRSGELRDAGIRLAGAIINGITFGLADKARSVADGAVNVVKGALGEAKSWLKVVGDPYSLVFMHLGESMMNGMTMALDADTSVEESAVDVVKRTADAFDEALTILTSTLGDVDEFNPTITPVLDLSRVAADAALIDGYIQPNNKIAPNVSLNQARIIASTEQPSSTTTEFAPGETGGVVFQQTINSPTQLATADIYKQTRNQITMAKEELAIP